MAFPTFTRDILCSPVLGTVAHSEKPLTERVFRTRKPQFENPKLFASDIACAITVFSENPMDWVARNGKESLFGTVEMIVPGISLAFCTFWEFFNFFQVICRSWNLDSKSVGFCSYFALLDRLANPKTDVIDWKEGWPARSSTSIFKRSVTSCVQGMAKSQHTEEEVRHSPHS